MNTRRPVVVYISEDGEIEKVDIEITVFQLWCLNSKTGKAFVGKKFSLHTFQIN